MSGAAAVLASMSLVAKLRLPMRVIGLIGAVENMPSSRAVKPGDIATSAAGLTVEILNTMRRAGSFCATRFTTRGASIPPRS